MNFRKSITLILGVIMFFIFSGTDRFFKKGGTPAALAEVDKIDSDYVKSHYIVTGSKMY